MQIIDNKLKYLDFEFVKDYDLTIDAYVTPYRSMLESIVRAIPINSLEKINVLEFGHGTGNLTAKFLEPFPNANVTGIDISPHMNQMAMLKLSLFKDRFNDIVADATKYAFNEKYDLILSSLFLHELSEIERTEIIKSVFDHLKENGLLVFGDYIPLKTKLIKQYFVEQWKQHMLERKITLKKAELEIAMHINEQWGEKEYIFSLQKAGLRQIECVWRDGFYAIIIAQKSG